MAFMFERLEVYQKAVDFADEIAAGAERFNRGYGFLAYQLNPAALSIALNLAEGNGRFTDRIGVNSSRLRVASPGGVPAR